MMGRRFLAWILDTILFLAAVLVSYAFLIEYTDVPPGLGSEACTMLQSVVGDEAENCVVVGERAFTLSASDANVQNVVSLGWFVFYVVVQGVTGGSPGKLLAGVRVVTADGELAGLGRSLGRTLLWAVDGAPWFVPLVGPIVALTSVGHRRIGDMAAGTYVVARSSVGTPVTGRLVSAAPPEGESNWGRPPEPAPPVAPSGWPVVEDPTVGTDAPVAGEPVDSAPASEPGDAPRSEAEPGPTSAPLRPPPQWDAGRGTYLQFEPSDGSWLQWNADEQRWEPLAE